ncbi:MAG TPA: hypothetical protein DCM08_02890, partial [Microscillaceae bacterium]|nr:hypothetical protein [Microscillaceae bacterium]
MELLPLKLIFKPNLRFTDDEFFQFCQDNPDSAFERDAQGNIILMASTGSNTSHHKSKITLEVGIWNKQKQLGLTFDSSGGFTLPNGAVRSPDVAFVFSERWQALTPAQREKFAHICPDFVIELRSPSDTLPNLQAKMIEWIAN